MGALKSVWRILRLVLSATAVLAVVIGGTIALMEISDWWAKRKSMSHGFSEEEVRVLADVTKVGRKTRNNLPAHGKAVVIAIMNNRNDSFGSSRSLSAPCIDDIHERLPKSMRASSVAETKVIVFLSWDESSEFEYVNGAEAYRESCHVELIDAKTLNLISEHTVLGSMPPKSYRTSSGHDGKNQRIFGTGCEDAVLEWLTQMMSTGEASR